MQELNEQKQIRLEKLQKIRDMGIEPYPYSFEFTHSVAELKEQGEELLNDEEVVTIAGRLMAVRGQGKAIFGNIQDKHHRIQIYVRLSEVGKEQFELFSHCDIGDYLGLSGPLMMTRTGELTLRVKSITLLSKSIRPMPVPKVKEKDGQTIVFDELRDKEFRYRQRYVDLTLNEKVAHVFHARSTITQVIRQYLLDNDYLEVETPTLQLIYGGANATPFKTHHKALGIDFFLRISNELYLKRLIVGGFDRVFEFVKDFRNEGIDRTHNPEFTVLEFYQAYADYSDMMTHCETLWEQCALAVHGSTEFEYQGKQIDVKAPWKRMTMLEAIEDVGEIPFSTMSDEEIQALLQKNDWNLDGEYSRGMAMLRVFEETCEEKFVQPTFVIDYPQETSPLCKSHRDKPGFIERFEVFINGVEVANAYSELNDPVIQNQHLEDQMKRGRGGEQETHPFDADYIRAMEYGMPPIGGIGIGIDRLVMLLTDQPNIRDVILFPTLRPENV